MAQKARHAFGMLENVDSAISNSTIDAYDILFVKDANGKPYIGWVDKDGNKVIVDNTSSTIVEGDSLPEIGETGRIYIFNEEAYVYNGTEYVNISQSVDLSELEKEVGTKVTAEEVKTMIQESSNSFVEIVEF